MPTSAPEVVGRSRCRRASAGDPGSRADARCATVAERAGLSESFLSQVERGRASASIASLRRIADALGVSMADLFEPGGLAQPRVLRRDERPTLAFGILGTKMLLTPRPLHHLEVFVGEIETGGSTGAEPYAHGDSEELFVFSAGPSASSSMTMFTSWRPATASATAARLLTALSNAGDDMAEVMWVISPPSY